MDDGIKALVTVKEHAASSADTVISSREGRIGCVHLSHAA
jgi:hypothetical protein